MKCLRPLLPFLMLILSSMQIAACGGGSKGTGTYSSDFDRDLLVSSISPEDRIHLCEGLAAHFRDLFREDILCPYAAVRHVMDNPGDTPIELCERRENLCYQNFAEISANLPPFECSFSSEDTKSIEEALIQCDVTFARFDTCMNEIFNFSRDFYSSFQCDESSVTREVIHIGDVLDTTNYSNLPACREIIAECD